METGGRGSTKSPSTGRAERDVTCLPLPGVNEISRKRTDLANTYAGIRPRAITETAWARMSETVIYPAAFEPEVTIDA